MSGADHLYDALRIIDGGVNAYLQSGNSDWTDIPQDCSVTELLDPADEMALFFDSWWAGGIELYK